MYNYSLIIINFDKCRGGECKCEEVAGEDSMGIQCCQTDLLWWHICGQPCPQITYGNARDTNVFNIIA